MYNIEMLADENALVGEGPVWDVNSETLYWTDIQNGRFFNYNPTTGVNKNYSSRGKYWWSGD